eukprot:TRINITY_DN29393_c0_g1_i1.p1 TRINITY_DN29393_c0_g1~~TRINITY_DN29393_c0_g1_i1.p1  ORF type:complete len:136 (-),score=29.58 TRINITY_DN29393_c0_g1_i1:98-451(-)
MKVGRDGHACAVLDNSLFVIGGYGAFRSVEIYNMLENTWNHEGPSLTRDLSYGHAVVYESRLFAVHRDGAIEELAGDWSGWKVVARVGEWGVWNNKYSIFYQLLWSLGRCSTADCNT